MARVTAIFKETLTYIVLIGISLPIILLYLLLFMQSLSIKLDGIIPKGFTLEYWKFMSSGNIIVPGTTGQYYPNVYLVASNTFMLALLIAFMEVILASLAGYSLSRFKFWGREHILSLTLILHAFPGITLLIALFYVLNSLHLYNTLVGVIIVKVALDLPLGIWIMKGFFDAVPWDVEMSALVDGCNRLGAWWRVIMPNVRNGLMAVLIFGFLSGWSEFIYVLTFIASQDYWTFSMLVYALTTGEYSYINPGVTATVAILYMIPVIIFFLFAQKYLLRIQIAGKSTV